MQINILTLFYFLFYVLRSTELVLAADTTTGTTSTTTNAATTPTTSSSTSLTTSPTSISTTKLPIGNAKTTAVTTGTTGKTTGTTGTLLPVITDTKKTTLAAATTTQVVPTKIPDTTIEFTGEIPTTIITTGTTADPNTYVWITVTHGTYLYPTQITYTQEFTSMYQTVQTWSSGSIGLGTIKGTIGTVRQYKTL
jgi:hypothetical protein